MDRVEQVARTVGVLAGAFVLSLTVVGPRSLWGLLGVVPIVMGLSGW